MKYTTAEVANKLDVSERHIRRLIVNGKLQANREGKNWIITERSLNCFKAGKLLVVIEGGIVKNKEGYFYYFNGTGYPPSIVYGPATKNGLIKTSSKSEAEKSLNNLLTATQREYGVRYEVYFDRKDIFNS